MRKSSAVRAVARRLLTVARARGLATAPLPPSASMPVWPRSGRPQYAYALEQAARLTQALGLPAMTALELGVAGGSGLIELERLAADIQRVYGIRVDVVGFDLGSGLPPPADYRDCPYIWQPGFYEMDVPALRRRLTAAKLVLGDVGVTGEVALKEMAAPIGFVAFDLDYYSSTRAAMESLLDGEPGKYLPRTLCYFDDIVGPDQEMHSQFTGELLAISEFNDAHRHRKIAKIHGLRHKLPGDAWWHDATFALHIFDHPLYNRYVYPDSDRQQPLT